MFRSAILVLAVGALAMAFAGAKPAEALGEAQVEYAFGVVDPSCNYACRTCPPDSAGNKRHDIVQSTTNGNSSSHLENCNIGDCSSHSCGETFPDGEELWFAAHEASGAKLLALVAEHSDRISLNVERRSVQVLCEAGQVVANLPLTTAQIKSIQYALAREEVTRRGLE